MKKTFLILLLSISLFGYGQRNIFKDGTLIKGSILNTYESDPTILSTRLGTNAGNPATASGNGCNLFAGYNAGNATTTGAYNVFAGFKTGYSNLTGQKNTFLGYGAGYFNTDDNNVFAGYEAGYTNTTGTGNTAIGNTAGYTNSTGDLNVFAGNQAGYYETASNSFYLHNGLGVTNLLKGKEHSLLYGTFNADSSLQTLRINGQLYLPYTTTFSMDTTAEKILLRNTTSGQVKQLSWGNFPGLSAGSCLADIYTTHVNACSNLTLTSPDTVKVQGIFKIDSAIWGGYAGSRRLIYFQDYNYLPGGQSGLTCFGANAGLSNIVPTSGSPFGTSNVFIGMNAGVSNTKGYRNVYIGDYAASEDSTGHDNTFVGIDVAAFSDVSVGNVAIGSAALQYVQTSANNVAIGYLAGVGITTGTGGNVCIGASSSTITTGIQNISIGYYSGGNTTSERNIFLGTEAGRINAAGYNIMQGYQSGYNATGIGNVFIGSQTGYQNVGNYNVLLGYQAGYNTKVSNKLMIANSNTDSLIYGTFPHDSLWFRSHYTEIGHTSSDSVFVPGNVRTDGALNVKGQPWFLNGTFNFGGTPGAPSYSVTPVDVDNYSFSKIGIGLASNTANYNLELLGTGSIAQYGQYTNTTLGTTTTDGSLLGINATGETSIFNQENGSVSFGTNNTEYARMDSIGCLRLGSTKTLMYQTTGTTATWKIKAIGLSAGINVTNTANSSTTSGGILTLCEDDGAALAATHRFMYILGQGSANTANLIKSGAAITAETVSTWSSTNSESELSFHTVPNTSTTITKRFVITSNGGEVWVAKQTGNITAGTGMTAAMLGAVTEYNGGSAIDITANPQIVAGQNGQIIRIFGTSDVNTLTFDDGTGLNLTGTLVLGLGDVLTLIYSTTTATWNEASFSNN